MCIYNFYSCEGPKYEVFGQLLSCKKKWEIKAKPVLNTIKKGTRNVGFSPVVVLLI